MYVMLFLDLTGGATIKKPEPRVYKLLSGRAAEQEQVLLYAVC